VLVPCRPSSHPPLVQCKKEGKKVLGRSIEKTTASFPPLNSKYMSLAIIIIIIKETTNYCTCNTLGQSTAHTTS
jgi:hypothetical protein